MITFKIILNYMREGSGDYFKPFTSDAAKLAQGASHGEGDPGAGIHRRFLFNLSEDPNERINLWDAPEGRAVRNELVARLCHHAVHNMVSSVYVPKVSGPSKKVMVQAFEAEDNFITWWEDAPLESNSPDTAMYPKPAYTDATCPFPGAAL